MGATNTTGRGTRTTTTLGGTAGGLAVVQAWREAWVADGGPEAVRAVGAWLSRQWGKVKRAVAAVTREFSPVLPASMAEAVPVLPVVESLCSVSYAAPTCTVTTPAQRWVSPLDVAVVRSAVQRLEAERVEATDAAPAEVLYVRKGKRYVALTETPATTAGVYRRVAVGKATRYTAL